jgi:hypothetical protein
MQKPSPGKTPAIRRLFWDLETSPNIAFSWRTGAKQYINPQGIIKERAIICIGRKWQGESKVRVTAWDSRQGDKGMLAEFLEEANEADELVAHWGDRFDMPWFRTRCLVHGLQPLPSYKTVDTCAWASRLCAFNSNKLDYIAKLLGVGSKISTDLDLWKKVVLNNDRIALAYMMKYCGHDIQLLEAVWGKLRVVAAAKTHVGVLNGGEKWQCAHCGSAHVKKDKTRVTAMGTIQHQMRCRKCRAYYTISEKSYQEYLDR